MPRTRVLLVGLPGLLSGVIRGLVDRSTELEIVGETHQQHEGMLDVIATTKPDVVVFGAQDVDAQADRPPPLETLRAAHPSVRIVAVDHDGRCATVYELNAPPRTAAEVSGSTLLSMIRGSTG